MGREDGFGHFLSDPNISQLQLASDEIRKMVLYPHQHMIREAGASIQLYILMIGSHQSLCLSVLAKNISVAHVIGEILLRKIYPYVPHIQPEQEIIDYSKDPTSPYDKTVIYYSYVWQQDPST
ncbi:hypothetical protein KC726_04290 [Candidatus Woesebacteria bacterium]|nr:hypothetical protein [Candidatus Woesebacteria bacterium]